MRPTRVAILGATGSIGTGALDVVRALPGRFEVVALTAHRDEDGLKKAAAEHPKARAVLSSREPGALVEIAAAEDVDVLVLAVVGSAGAAAALAAAGAGKVLALANKESVVMAGPLLMPLAKKSGATILPIDSEHSAIFQALQCGRRQDVAKVILTASGGPFRTWSAERMAAATVEDALNHPTWNMGTKNTLDSATLFNKALELLEAAWLFDLSADELEVVVHPQSVVHSMVEFQDGSVMAQLSPPDMRLPIQLALCHPERPAGPARRMDWRETSRLDFEPPDVAKFPALRLADRAIRAGGTAGATLNAANEVAGQAFLDQRIKLTQVAEVVEATMAAHPAQPATDWPTLQAADEQARRTAEQLTTS
jgi:1-deoxy-D-xylulose-5-phosphate reductoisomerase